MCCLRASSCHHFYVSSSPLLHVPVVVVVSVCSLFGAVHTSGSNQALFTNAVIPVTMVLSYLILKQKFRLSQCIGAAIIMLGIVTVLLPQMFPSLAPSNDTVNQDDDDDIGGDDNSDLPLFNLLFILSVIPGALSSIYKEMAFVAIDIDANYLQAWVSLWQTIFGFALIPLNTLSFLGPQSVKWSELISSFINGMWCLLGYNLIHPPHCTRHHIPESPLPTCDDCHGAWIPIVLYIVFNLLFNVFTVLLIKYGSSTLMFIIMTLRMPLVQLAFTMRMFSDPPDSFGWSAGTGLILILIGLGCYRYSGKKKKSTLPAKAKVVVDEEGEMNVEALSLPFSDQLPLLTRALTTGSIADVDSDEYEEQHMIIPLLSGNSSNRCFACRHHEGRIRLQRTDQEIRAAYLTTLGVPPQRTGNGSPQRTLSPQRSPTISYNNNNTSTISSSRTRSPAPSCTNHSPINYGSLGERKDVS